MAERFTPPPGSMGCLSVSAVLLSGLTIGLTYRFVHTLNPLDVFSTGTTGQAVAVAACGLLAGFSVLQLVGFWFQSLATKRIDPRLKALLGCAIIGVIALVLSYSFTGNLNPIDTFRAVKGGRLVAVIAVSILFGFSALQLLFWLVVIGRIEKTSRGSFWDVRCRFCNRPVCEVSIQTGFPFRCGHCSEWVHSAHWTANGGSPMRRCPGCVQPSDRGQLDDFLREWRDKL